MQGSFEKAAALLSSRKFLALVLCIAFALRAGWAVAAGDAQRFWDSDSYITIADSLRAGAGLVWGGQHAGRPPVYPLLVAATRFEVFGREFLLLYTVQAFLGTLAVWFFAAAARRLLGGVAAGLTAAALAIYPFHIFYVATVLSEVLFVFLLATLFVMLTRLWCEPTVRSAAWAGMLAGATFLTRPSISGLLVVYAVLLVLRGRSTRKAATAGAVMLAIAFSMALPWAARNNRCTGHWVFTTTGVGASLYDGVGPQADGSSNMEFLNEMPELQTMGEFERDVYLRRKSFEAIAAEPLRIARLALTKAWRFWTPVPNSGEFRHALYFAVSLLAVLPVYVGAVLALVRRVISREKLALLAAAPVYFTLLHMLFVGSTRYRAPVMPFVAIMAAAGAAVLFVPPPAETEG